MARASEFIRKFLIKFLYAPIIGKIEEKHHDKNFTMKFSKSLSSRINIVIIILLAIISFTIHIWNRSSHHVVSLPTTDEKNISYLVFIATLLLCYSVPLVLVKFTPITNGHSRWPIYETLTVIVGLFLCFIFFSIDLSGLTKTLNKISNYQDVIGVFLAYIAAILAYSFSFKNGLISWQARDRGRALANASMALLSAIIFFFASYMVVYFE